MKSKGGIILTDHYMLHVLEITYKCRVNKNLKASSFESNENTHARERRSYCAISDNESSSATLNTLVMNDRGLYCNLVIYLRVVFIKDLFNSKEGSY